VLAQRRALDELHRQEDAALGVPHVVHGDEVRVTHAGDEARLAFDLAGIGGAPRPHQLERHLAIELRIVGGEHDPHPAVPDQAQHDVPADRGPR